MLEENVLKEQDARLIVRLLGETAVVEGDHRVKKRFLLEGLAKIIEADVWIWLQVRTPGDDGGMPVPFLMIDGGWLNDQQKSMYLQWHLDPEYQSMVLAQLNPLRHRHYTRSRQQIVDDKQWYGSAVYRRWCEQAELDHFLGTSYPVGVNDDGESTVSGMMFYRACGKPSFNGRERFIVHLITSEIDWLHHQGTDVLAADHVSSLPPRLQQVMLLLLSGAAPKQIAFKLELSVNTVREYCQSLYKRFNVQGRDELVAMFIAGDASAKAGPTACSRS